MGTSAGGLERVLLAMPPGRTRESVEAWLERTDRYEVTTASNPEELTTGYDICLVDGPGLDRLGNALRERRDRSESFLPHLLLSGGGELEASPHVAGAALVDDVLELPLGEERLARRIDNLLATRRASVELAERETQYRELIELTPEAVLLVDDGEVVYANAAAVELFGAAATELCGEALMRFVDGVDAPVLEALLDTVPPAGSGASEFVEVGFRSVTGRRIDASVAGIEVTFGGREVVQLIVQDRTEARRREERLRLFGRAVEATAHGITIVDVQADDRPLIYANAGFTHITGYPLGEILGRNCRFLQGENTDQSTVDTVRAAIEAGESVSVDVLNYRKDGTPFWNRLDLVPIDDGTGKLTHYLGFQRDITEQVRNEQRLAVLDRILRHNVRNKTNVIRGYARAILEDAAAPAVAAERIVAAADDLYTVSEQVREFDSVVRNTESSTEVIELDAVVGEGVRAMREEFPGADVQFRTVGTASIRAHPTLRAALQNLLNQLGEADEPAAEISLVRRGDDVRLDVCDRGDAISREDLELVARRSETPLEHLQGLELWLLRWAVEQSDGEFAVRDADGDPLLRMRFPAADGDDRLRDS